MGTCPPGLIMQNLSGMTYLIKCGGDIVWKRHINQIIFKYLYNMYQLKRKKM